MQVQSWKETYRGIVKDSILDHMDAQEREKGWKQAIDRQGIVNVLCEEQNGIVGFASGGRNRHLHLPYEGELYTLYLLAAYHGKGWGKALFLQTMREIKEEGYSSALVWVLSENKTRFFYEALGGEKVAVQYIDGLAAEETAYGWNDLEWREG